MYKTASMFTHVQVIWLQEVPFLWEFITHPLYVLEEEMFYFFSRFSALFLFSVAAAGMFNCTDSKASSACLRWPGRMLAVHAWGEDKQARPQNNIETHTLVCYSSQLWWATVCSPSSLFLSLYPHHGEPNERRGGWEINSKALVRTQSATNTVAYSQRKIQTCVLACANICEHQSKLETI